MAGMGQVPKRDSRHRGNDTLASALVALPPEGREGDTPDWPLPKPTAPERKVWAELWATPQAVAWERLGWTRAVARYVRVLVTAEKPEASAAVLSEVRQMEDRLGLTPMAMLRLRWAVAVDEDEPGADLVVVDDERWRNAAAG